MGLVKFPIFGASAIAPFIFFNEITENVMFHFLFVHEYQPFSIRLIGIKFSFELATELQLSKYFIDPAVSVLVAQSKVSSVSVNNVLINTTPYRFGRCR